MANNKYKLIRTNERCVRMTNLKEQSWKPEVFLTNERTEVKGLRKEILLTNNNKTNRRFKSEKEGNVTGYQEASHTQLENAFEGGKIQPSNELKNPGGIQNVIKSENLLIKVEADDELSLRDECTIEIEDFKRENNVSCTTQLTEHDTNKESVESSTKKYPSLSVTVSESVDRKVVVQPFHLDSNVVNPFAGFTTIENIDDDNKYKLKNKCYTSDLIRGKPKICDPLSKQIILTPKKKTEKSDENSDDEFELEYNKLFELIENDIVVKKEIKYSGFQSDAESDDELEEKHRNRRLQVERPSLSSVKSENRECRKPREKKLDFHQINQRRKRCKSSYDHCKDKRFNEADESCSPPQVKRLKWPSGIIKKTETDAIKTKQEKLSMGKQANKSAEFWSEVLTTPKLWKTEYNEIDIGICHKETFEMNYHELLNTYISINSVRSKLDNVCWETTFLEKFKDPNSMHYILEYYIPPAQAISDEEFIKSKTVTKQNVLVQNISLLMEHHSRKRLVVFFKLTLKNESSCIECLRKVCENRNWPPPVYKLITQSDNTTGFVYSCELKSLQFSSSKPAFNHQLAQELAAHNCLDWLGLGLCLTG